MALSLYSPSLCDAMGVSACSPQDGHVDGDVDGAGDDCGMLMIAVLYSVCPKDDA